jgi:hypothetical protein
VEPSLSSNVRPHHPQDLTAIHQNRIWKSEISDSQAREYAGRHEIDYIETSAKDGTGVEDAFVRLAARISEKVSRGEISAQITPKPDAPYVPVMKKKTEEKEKEKSGSCC